MTEEVSIPNSSDLEEESKIANSEQNESVESESTEDKASDQIEEHQDP